MRVEELLPHIYEKVTGVPRTVALRRLLEATRQFCRDTHAWRENMRIILTEGQDTYMLPPQEVSAPLFVDDLGSAMVSDQGLAIVEDAAFLEIDAVRHSVHKVHQVLLGDRRRPVSKKTETQMELECNPSASSTVQFYTQPRASLIKFYGRPSAAVAGTEVIINASCVPDINAVELPDALAGRYYEVLVAGALSLLFGSPHERWSNITQAQRFAGAFAAGSDDARIEVEHEFSNRVVRVTGYGGI